MEQSAPVAGLEEQQARRNALILATANAVGGAAGPIAFTLGGIVGAYLLGPDKTLATVPVTAMNLGVAIGAIPAARLMRRIGRRNGFMVGSLIAIAGGLWSAAAIAIGSFVAFSLGLLIVGISGAFLFQYRFAAGEAGSKELRAKAISWVLAGGIVSAVIGAQALIFTSDLLAPIPYAGAYVALSIVSAIGLAIISLLGGQARLPPPEPAAGNHGRPLIEIARQPRFIVAVICAMAAFGVMALVMTAAPLAMVEHHHTQDNAALGIQWHVIAMFAPSFFTGSLVARFGKEPIIIVGVGLLVACAIVALTGLDLTHFWGSLVLLGIGWNFAFIGATAMLGETYRPEERGRVEGFNDFLIFGSVALASFFSGSLLAFAGWSWVVFVIFPAAVVSLLALASQRLTRRAA